VILSVVVAFGAGLASGLLIHRVNEEHRTVPVVIAVKDIPANTELNGLVHSGDFIVVSIPETQKLPAALSSLDELRGHWSAQDIHRYEQVVERSWVFLNGLRVRRRSRSSSSSTGSNVMIASIHHEGLRPPEEPAESVPGV
jgi:hypothetical protein